MKKFLGFVLFSVISLMVAGIVMAQDVTITFQYRGGGLRTEVALAWIAEFEAENPGVKVEFLPAPSGYEDRTIVAWAGGTGPDVTEVFGNWGQAYARAGVLLDLRPYIERDYTQEDIADIWPIAWETSFVSSGEMEGVMYRLPRYMITTVHYYNDDHFAAAGLVPPNELEARGEWNYDAVRDLAKKLTRSDGNRITRYGFSTNTRDYRRLDVWARAFGGGFFNFENPHEFTGNRDEAVRAISLLQEMIWEDQSTSPTFARAAFFTGDISMVEEGNHSVLDQFERHIAGGFAWDIAPSPMGVNGRKAYSGDDGWAIWKDTPHPDEAWKFIKFLASKRGQEIASQYEGLAPIRRSAMPFYQQLAPHVNLGALFVNMIDPGPPLTTLLVGDVAQIANTLNQGLDTALIQNAKPWAAVAQEIKPIIEAYSRQ